MLLYNNLKIVPSTIQGKVELKIHLQHNNYSIS